VTGGKIEHSGNRSAMESELEPDHIGRM